MSRNPSANFAADNEPETVFGSSDTFALTDGPRQPISSHPTEGEQSVTHPQGSYVSVSTVRGLYATLSDWSRLRLSRLEVYPSKAIAFPFARKNNELAQLVRTSFHIRKEAYAAH